MPFDSPPKGPTRLSAVTRFSRGTSDSLDAYLQALQACEPLSRKEELRLAQRLKNGDRSAAQDLVLSNLRFVVWVARGYRGYGLPLADLIQQGNLGLLRAIKRFDPSRGVRLMSFSVHWIRAEIHEYILRNWRIVRRATTKTQRKLFFNRGMIARQLGESEGHVEGIAGHLDVSPDAIRDAQARFASSDVSFDATPEEGTTSWADRLSAPGADPATQSEESDWQQRTHGQITSALKRLDDRSRDIVSARFLNEGGPENLMSLAKKHGVSAERIRQIQNRALKQLRGALAAA